MVDSSSSLLAISFLLSLSLLSQSHTTCGLTVVRGRAIEKEENTLKYILYTFERH